MPISQQEIKLFLTGGVNNTNPFLSLGGFTSHTEVSSSGFDNLFGDVTTDQALAGDTTYRCVTVANTSNLMFRDAAFYIEDDPRDWIWLGLNPELATFSWPDQTFPIQSIQDEHSAPIGVNFIRTCANWFFTPPGHRTDCTSIGFGSDTNPPIGTDKAPPLEANTAHSFWIRRKIPAGSSPTSNYSFAWRINGNPGA